MWVYNGAEASDRRALLFPANNIPSLKKAQNRMTLVCLNYYLPVSQESIESCCAAKPKRKWDFEAFEA